MTRLLCAGFLVLFSLSARAQDWPQFRGHNASGVAASGRPPIAWDVRTSRNIRWRLPVPGLAHSSPIVWGERVYVTTAVPLEKAPDELRLGEAGIGAAADMVRHSWRIYAIDRATGRVVWERAAVEGVPRIKRHVKASHASATPATNGRYVAALFGSEGLFCFDIDGKLLWRQDLGLMDVGLANDPSYQWGPASSPVIVGDLAIVQNDRHKGSMLVAFDLASGREAWRSPRDEWPAWSTPAVLRSSTGSGPGELITNSPNFIRGHDPRTGKELWRIEDPGGEVKVVTPVVADDLAIVTGGYPSGGRPIYAIRSGGRVAWRAENGSPYTPTPIVYEGLLYVLRDNGVLAAYDVKTGERIYQERLATGTGSFSASPVAADGKLYFASEDGEVFVARAGRTFELLARSSMGEVCMATPAISGDLLLVRTRSALYAIGSPPGAASH
jgi:outer membrane protein assembly factor BamB